MTNPFELSARSTKARRIVTAIDRHLAERGINPHRDAAGIAAGLKGWSRNDWARLARAIEINPPSADTVVVVVGVYRNRAVAQRKAS